MKRFAANRPQKLKNRAMAAVLLSLCILLAGCGATAQLPTDMVETATAETATAETATMETATAETATTETAVLETDDDAANVEAEATTTETAEEEADAQQPAAAPALSLTQALAGDGQSQAMLIALYLQQILGMQEDAVPVDSAAKLVDAGQMLADYCANQGGNISVWMEDLETGTVTSYNTEAVYYGASTLKGPYALWLCQKADAGQIDIDAQLYNNHQGQMLDSMLAQYNESETVPVRQLLTAMIVESDNNATDILMRNWPGNASTGYTDYLIGLGFAPESAQTCLMESAAGIKGYVTVADGAAAMEHCYDYFESDAPHAAILKEIFCQAKHDILYVPAGVASAKKYGSWDAAFHDEMIVYAAHPYLLCVYTDWGNRDIPFPPEAVEMMQPLGKMVYQYYNG